MDKKNIINIEEKVDVTNRNKKKTRQEEIIKLVMRQTDYDEETTKQKLSEWNYNYIKVIKEYINPKFDEKSPVIYKSRNQGVMTEIRGFMDTINKEYYQKKELTDKYKMMMAAQMARRQNQKINVDASNNVC